ncbi:MAG: hypothetical protein KIS85_07940 [Anaerolineales bacterium]|nr:hypothetical protein [Anaerolineales bacterium]
MKKTWIILLTVLALTLVSFQPVMAAATWDLNVHNDTEETVKVNLTGPKNYSFDVAPGKLAKTVEQGTYKYSYNACGQSYSGEITVNGPLQWLVIPVCPPPLEYAKFVVDSRIPTQFTLKMVGPESYDLAINPLTNNRFPSLAVGDYAYSYTACGGTYGGSIRVTKNGQARLPIYPCEVVDFRLAAAAEQDALLSSSNLRIGSHYAFPIRITLIGPTSYSVVASLGTNRFNVFPGTYDYYYSAYGVSRSGTVTVGEAGAWITISPLRP